MPALSIIDLAMFLLETPERPFNIGPLLLLDPPARARATFADRLVTAMLKRPPGAPFNYRLRAPLFGMPALEAGPDADPAAHVHRMTLPAPGSFAQLSAEVCRLHAQRLDRSRLLWDLYVIDGLEGGKVAIYGKTHHGIIDGRGFVLAVSNWLALTPGDRAVRAMWEGVPGREVQADAQADVQASVAARMTGLLGKAGGIASSAVGLYGMLARQGLKALGVGGTQELSLPFTGIPRALGGKSTASRSFAYTRLPIGRMKALAKAHDATLNDLLLACLDIALARYLQEHGRAPDRALVAAMPIALADATGGNQIAALQFPMGAPGLDAAARLKAIRVATATVKHVVQTSSSDTVMLYTTLVHGLPALIEKAGLKSGLPVSNLMVSNPFGFPEKRYLMGATVELVLPISVVPAGQMLNVTSVTLDDDLQVGFLAMPEAVPGVERLARYTCEAFDELARALSATDAASAHAVGRSAAAATASPRMRRAGRSTRTGTAAAKEANAARTCPDMAAH